MTNTTIRKKPAKKPAASVSRDKTAEIVAAAELKTLRLKNIKHACEMYTGGGSDALDQFRTTLGFLLGTFMVMPKEVREATTIEMVIKSVIDSLDNTKTLFINNEPVRLASMEAAMEEREANIANENQQQVD